MGLLPPPPMSLSYRDGGGSGGDLRGRSDTSERTYQLSLTLESVLLGQFVCVDLGPQGPPKDAATAGVFSSTLSMAQAERTCYKMKAFWSEWRVIEGGTICNQRTFDTSDLGMETKSGVDITASVAYSAGAALGTSS
ncbi:hypothetical protein HPP92_025352 [Vanilla planifolia]|uniref:Uncharacterized protein n=1 Tax=Vanilla planifolia TaxID=51239 RepID=A0A835PJU5_VANPL|nr:hypothetical protein HPP92_025352 [Vanilla planifolia]